MFYHSKTQTKIPEGTAFVLGNIQYPANWLNLSSSTDKRNAGLSEIIQTSVPSYNPETEQLIPGEIVQQGDVWYTSWRVISHSPEVLANKKEAKDRVRLVEIDEELLQIDASVQRSLREVTIAMANGDVISELSVSKLNKAEADAAQLRIERKNLTLPKV